MAVVKGVALIVGIALDGKVLTAVDDVAAAVSAGVS
jgi:hypothetical protein